MNKIKTTLNNYLIPANPMSFEYLISQGLVIRDEILLEKNTALRVGQYLLDVINFFKTTTVTAEELEQLTELISNMGTGIKSYGAPVDNIADLNSIPNREVGLAAVVKNDIDEFGSSYIHLCIIKIPGLWVRTPFTVSNVDIGRALRLSRQYAEYLVEKEYVTNGYLMVDGLGIGWTATSGITMAVEDEALHALRIYETTQKIGIHTNLRSDLPNGATMVAKIIASSTHEAEIKSEIMSGSGGASIQLGTMPFSGGHADKEFEFEFTVPDENRYSTLYITLDSLKMGVGHVFTLKQFSIREKEKTEQQIAELQENDLLLKTDITNLTENVATKADAKDAQNIPVLYGEKATELTEANKSKIPNVEAVMKALAKNEENSIAPIGMNSFDRESTIALKDSKLNRFKIKGDFTAIKRFNTGQFSYGSAFVNMENDNKDSIFIGNNSYTFTVLIKKAGTTIFNYTEESNIIFNDDKKEIVFVRVDFAREEIVLQRREAPLERVFAVVGLKALKDVEFERSMPCIFTYKVGTKDVYIVSGLYDISKYLNMFSSDLNLPQPQFFLESNSRLNTKPLSCRVFEYKSYKPFVSGEATFIQGVDFTGVSSNSFVHFNNNPSSGSYRRVNRARFSIRINNGSLALGISTVSIIYCISVTDKATLQTTNHFNVSAVNTVSFPKGDYLIDVLYFIVTSSGDSYSIACKSMDAGTSITLFDDFERHEAPCLQAAIPRLASFNKIFDVAQAKVYNGIIGLTDNY